MSKTNKKNIPQAVFDGNDNASSIIKNIQQLTVGELIELYAYSQAIVETVREPLIILDKNLRVKTANKSFYDSFKINKKKTEGTYIHDLNDGEWNIPELRTLLNKILSKNSYFNNYEVTHDFKKLGTKTMLLNARRIILEGHKTYLILLAMEDITERRKAQKIQEEYEGKLQTIFDSIKNFAIFTLNTQGVITSWNIAVKTLFGYSEKEFVGKHFSILFTPEDNSAGLPTRELENAVKEGKSEDENWIVRKNGSRLYATGYSSPIYDSRKKVTGFVKVVTDFTEKRMLEQRKDDFISTASHELKTPLTSMQAYTQILHKHLETSADKKALNIISKMQNQNQRLGTLINSLLDVAKITAGEIEFHKTHFDVTEWVTETVESVQATAEKHSLIIENTMKGTIHGDRDYLIQVLTNLLSNAIKYSPKANRVIIEIVEDKGSAVISVHDFGLGISQKDQEKLFNRFTRVGGTRTKTAPGLGLGLFISKGIIERHRGKIWLKSQAGKGTTFSFSIPLIVTKN